MDQQEDDPGIRQDKKIKGRGLKHTEQKQDQHFCVQLVGQGGHKRPKGRQRRRATQNNDDKRKGHKTKTNAEPRVTQPTQSGTVRGGVIDLAGNKHHGETKNSDCNEVSRSNWASQEDGQCHVSAASSTFLNRPSLRVADVATPPSTCFPTFSSLFFDRPSTM